MSQILLYILFFVVGLIAGGFYFTHLWKSVNAYKSDKSKIIFSSFIRFPVPLVAVFVAGFFAGIGGILAVIFGFSVFQFIYLIKKGSQLKKDIEEYANSLENQEQENSKNG